MAWFLLVIAGLFEVAWAVLLGETKGFTRLAPTIGFLATITVSMVLLSIATRTIPISTGYAVWVGIGAVGAFVYSVTVRHEQTSTPQVIAIAALIVSIVAVKATAVH